MARDVFDVELGYAISAENGDRQVLIISGTAAPDGTSGKQSEAPIGSLYLRSGTGELYQKIANAGAPADYELNSATGSMAGNWRTERVDAHTGQVLTAGNTDPTTWSDNDDGTAAAAFTIGNYVLDGNCALWEITGISAPNITLAAAATAPVTDDMFAVKYNMPDPAGQENQAIIVYDGSACIKVADVDFSSAEAISLVAPYSPINGNPAASDTVQTGIEKLDGNQQDIQTSLGIAQGDVDFGTFTGDIIPDNSTAKASMQSLETELVDTRDNVDDLITLSGVAENSTDLGTFTGDIISDNTTNKGAMQELETELVDTRDNTDDLITLSGVAENSTDLGAFTSPADFLLTATETIKSALQKLGDYLFGIKVTQTTGVTTATAVDAIAHATYRRVVWHVEVFETATPANREGFTIEALTDGTNVDDTKYAKLKLGSNIAGLTSTVGINGANLELQIAATPSCTVNVRRITVV